MELKRILARDTKTANERAIALYGRNVLVISNGGLVLFSKEFVNAALEQPSLVGSLLTAMLEFSTNNVGAPVCYIELSNIAVSICR